MILAVEVEFCFSTCLTPATLSSTKEVVDTDSGLSKNGAKRSFRNISGVAGDGNLVARSRAGGREATAWIEPAEPYVPGSRLPDPKGQEPG